MKYDVIVLGSGPAGTAAAITCHQAGLQSALVTSGKKASVTEANPVQSIHPGVVTLLQELGLEDTLEGSTRSSFESIQVNGKTNPLNPYNNEAWYGHHLNRHLWDKALLNHLDHLPLDLFTDTTVNKITRGTDSIIEVFINPKTKIQGKYLIDASGYRRISRHFLKLDEIFLTHPMTCWTGRSRSSKRHDISTSFTMNKNGWTWLAPESENIVTWNTLRVDKGLAPNDLLPDLEPVGKATAHNVRWRVFRPICDQQVLLCGDAAGILDPAAGQGILSALLSGIKAGQCLNECNSNPEQEVFFFAMYDQWFISQFEQKVEDLANYYKVADISILLHHQEDTITTS
ncbi:MAG: FAD-dependent monooxygenase [Cytophagales bacterium]|nr:FAD-dependent monooxygenase [Cytophagales bacterium]